MLAGLKVKSSGGNVGRSLIKQASHQFFEGLFLACFLKNSPKTHQTKKPLSVGEGLGWGLLPQFSRSTIVVDNTNNGEKLKSQNVASLHCNDGFLCNKTASLKSTRFPKKIAARCKKLLRKGKKTFDP